VARTEARRLLSQERGLLSLDQGPPRSAPRGDGEEGPLPLVERLARPVDVELAVEAREALRSLADLRWRRRRVLALQAAGYGYKEIAEMLSVTYTNVNRHVTEGRGELRQLRDAA
jgi:DNA-directed RNA polymerase specialized sigma24 family protein